MPRAYQQVAAQPDRVVKLVISGEGGDSWYLRYTHASWELLAQVDLPPTCTVQFDAETAWRLFTKGIALDQARTNAIIEGDNVLANPVFTMVSMIA